MAAAAAPGLGAAAQENATSINGSGAIPDLSGVWAHTSITGFEPLASGPTSIKNLSRRGVTSDNRQLVGDYQNPILQPWAADVVKSHGEISLAGIGYPTPRNQCWPGGIPFVFTTTAIQVLQQPAEITFIYYEDHEVRHVRMNQPHPDNVTPSWYGDSVGHFEGDTLVIDTVGLAPQAVLQTGVTHSKNEHIVERYRLSEPNMLEVKTTIEDPGVLAKPWETNARYLRHPEYSLAEYICEQNNRNSFENGKAGINLELKKAP
jgi:hypothetical protein